MLPARNSEICSGDTTSLVYIGWEYGGGQYHPFPALSCEASTGAALVFAGAILWGLVGLGALACALLLEAVPSNKVQDVNQDECSNASENDG